jgi:prepilin-type N-terminal cleavage/methylation domain-containing protein
MFYKRLNLQENKKSFPKYFPHQKRLIKTPVFSKKKGTGFTLIELLVVISIIGMLASVVLIALSAARRKGRDAKRIADVSQMKTVLELYLSTFNYYPTATSGGGTVILSNVVGLTPTYVGSLPISPLPPEPGCGADYLYQTAAIPSSYTITFCIGGVVGPVQAGTHTLTPGTGIQ